MTVTKLLKNELLFHKEELKITCKSVPYLKDYPKK